MVNQNEETKKAIENFVIAWIDNIHDLELVMSKDDVIFRISLREVNTESIESIERSKIEFRGFSGYVVSKIVSSSISELEKNFTIDISLRKNFETPQEHYLIKFLYGILSKKFPEIFKPYRRQFLYLIGESL